MPEYPDVETYVAALRSHAAGRTLRRIRLASPFLLRSVDPPLSAFEGRAVVDFRRLGKRIVFDFGDALYLVLHLMIAGRLRWKPAGAPVPRKLGLAAFDFAAGTLLLTEAGTKKRAALHAVRGAEALAAHDPGGLEVVGATPEAFARRLRLHNHTVKRALTDPTLFSGIGNAYSDEILHRARLSPLRWTQRMDDDEVCALHEAAVEVLTEWAQRLRAECGDGFPDKVTAFRPEMAVHGRYREPCPVCGDPVQRIVRTDHEMNYCATCQTGGKVLADRGLSRLLRGDWPRTLEEWERLRRPDAPAEPGSGGSR